MTKLSKMVALVCFGAMLSGCITPHAYVDPSYHKATYENIQRPATPAPVKVDVQFQRNGKPLPAVDKELRGHVERSLRATGVFVPNQDANATLSVVGNNIADLAAARAKGFKTGLTFGGSGTMVDDNYEFSCSYSNSSGAKHEANYQHAIHTALGHTNDRPAGLTPTTLADAFSHVVEDVMLNCVKDLQDANLAPPR